MNFSTILKGAAVAASFALVVSEASAQLPVRTRSLQLLSNNANFVQHQAPNGLGASTTYTWPTALPGVGNAGVLRSDVAGVLSWQEFDENTDIITGDGSNGQVAYFNGDNTITSSANFTYSGGGGIGVGNTAVAGTIAIGDGDSHTGTVQTANLTGDQTYTLPNASGNIPVSTNTPVGGTENYIAVSNGDGTFTWVVSTTTNLQRGRVALTAGNFTQTVTFATPYIAPVTAANIVVTANMLSADANIFQITGVTLTGFTIESTAPFGASDEIMWTSNVQ